MSFCYYVLPIDTGQHLAKCQSKRSYAVHAYSIDYRPSIEIPYRQCIGFIDISHEGRPLLLNRKICLNVDPLSSHLASSIQKPLSSAVVSGIE